MWIIVVVSLVAFWCLMSVPLGMLVGRAIRGVPTVQPALIATSAQARLTDVA